MDEIADDYIEKAKFTDLVDSTDFIKVFRLENPEVNIRFNNIEQFVKSESEKQNKIL